jgi:hypothetical protein
MTNELRELITSTTELYDHEIVYISGKLNDEEAEFWRRTFVRTVVSSFEAELFILKSNLLSYCKKNDFLISPQEELFLDSKKYELNENGQLKEKLYQQKVKDEIKFVFNSICRIQGFTLKQDFENQGWQDLCNVIKIRNRLTHPKSLEDQYVSSVEVSQCENAWQWFNRNVIGFSFQQIAFYKAELNRLQGNK